MPKISMTIDLDIEEGLYIKIDSKGRVSIRAESQQAQPQPIDLNKMQPWAAQTLAYLKDVAPASTKQEILRKRKRSTIEELKQQREAVLHLMQPFTHETLRELGIIVPKRMTTRLLREGSIRVVRSQRGRPGLRGGTSPTLFEVVHNA